MSIEIRQENPADISAIRELHQSAFGQNNEANLVDLLRKSDAYIPGLSLVAAMGDEIVGHILFTNIKIVNDQGTGFESLALAPMAVRKDFQRQGIGGQLIRHGLERAKESGYKSVIVLGHESYYPKFGFEPAEKWNIRAPYDVPSNVFMAIELVENGLAGVSGTVQYPKEFEAV